MALLTIVRHGQASLGGGDYDRLSDLGKQQSRLLGHYLGARGRRWDRVLTGPLRRHRETYREAADAYLEVADAPLPEAEEIDGLTEHQAIALVDHLIGDNDHRDSLAKTTDAAERQSHMKAWFQEFDRIMRGWVRREIVVPHLEDWQQARHRVAQTLELLTAENNGQELLAFTSGGFLSMAVGEVLGLDDEAVYDLSLEVHNTSWAEIRIGNSGRRSLRTFNWHPHLTTEEELTLV